MLLRLRSLSRRKLRRLTQYLSAGSMTETAQGSGSLKSGYKQEQKVVRAECSTGWAEGEWWKKSKLVASLMILIKKLVTAKRKLIQV